VRTVPCRLVPSHTVSHRAVSHRTVPRRAVPCRVAPYLTVSCHNIVSYRVMLSYGVVSYRVVSYRIVPYRAIPYRFVPYRIVSYRAVSRRTAPYRTVSYRTALCWDCDTFRVHVLVAKICILPEPLLESILSLLVPRDVYMYVMSSKLLLLDQGRDLARRVMRLSLVRGLDSLLLTFGLSRHQVFGDTSAPGSILLAGSSLVRILFGCADLDTGIRRADLDGGPGRLPTIKVNRWTRGDLDLYTTELGLPHLNRQLSTNKYRQSDAQSDEEYPGYIDERGDVNIGQRYGNINGVITDAATGAAVVPFSRTTWYRPMPVAERRQHWGNFQPRRVAAHMAKVDVLVVQSNDCDLQRSRRTWRLPSRTPHDLVEQFDLEICMSRFDGKTFHIHDANNTFRLRSHVNPDRVLTCQREKKYCDRGIELLRQTKCE